MNADTVQATEEYPILVDLIQRVEGVEADLAPIERNEGERQAGEGVRQAQEAMRVSNENVRIANEAARQTYVNNLSVDAVTRDSGMGATVERIPQGGSVKLRFGIPHGADGKDAINVAVNGMFYTRITDDGYLMVGVADGVSMPPLSINGNGDLIYTI